MSNTSQWHYTDKAGQQLGPISTDELIQLIASKSVPTSAMAWKDGMAGWKPVSQIKELQTSPGSIPVAPNSPQPAPKPTAVAQALNPANALAPRPTAQQQPAASMTPVDPYETPSVPTDEEFYASLPTTSYPGIGRLAYFLLSIVVAIITQVITSTLGGEQIEPTTSIMVTGGSFVASMLLAFSRLKNIGMSRWWFLGNFVPILNFFVSVWIMSRQEGWVETQELDTPGKIIAWIMWLLIIFAILAVIGTLFFFFFAASSAPTG